MTSNQIPYSIVIEDSDGEWHRVIRAGKTIFVSGEGEILLVGVPSIPFDILSHDVFYNVSDGIYMDAGKLQNFRVWCFSCRRYYEIEAVSFPETCPNTDCVCSQIADVTEEQYALRGYPVTVVTGLTGHHFKQFDAQGKWSTYFDYVYFRDIPETVPHKIQFSNVAMDGMNDLAVMEINDYGFKYRVTAVGPRNTMGTVEFDWEAQYE